jgi:curved DNA-binding protein CbpA
MKLDSKYFDMIRINRGGSGRKRASQKVSGCQWKGCEVPGLHRAPKGRGREGEYFVFCAEHVRHYNATYNYFDGMSDSEVEKFQKDAIYGHRPTWKVGANAWAHGVHQDANGAGNRFADNRQTNGQSFHAWRARQAREEPQAARRRLKPMERKSLDSLGLGDQADRVEIKARFKELVKRHHPDSNGGDRASEDKLREIIQAYNYLKQAGLV